MVRRSIVALWAMLLLTGCGASKQPAAQPFPGVSYVHESRKTPAEQIHVASIDLADPRISIHVVRAADPDGAGPWQTALARTSTLAEQNQLDVTVNGDFFSAKDKIHLAGKEVPYFAGNHAKVSGMAMSDGKLWSERKGRCALVVYEDGHVTIGKLDSVPPAAQQIIGGSHQLLTAGKKTADGKDRAPRTAVGVDRSGKKLILTVVDGRQRGYSEGMTLGELADEMRRLGCWDAMNLDGGGSSAMVLREANHWKVVNRPSDGSDLPISVSIERPVANALGIRIKGLHPATQPAPHAELPPFWFKGNLHCHSFWSDGDDFPDMVAKWYRDHGYNFLAISDHNVVLRGPRWISQADLVKKKAMDAVGLYAQAFPQAIEMRRDARGPAVRLRTVDELRSDLEQPGRFILIDSEEISATVDKRPLHINATNTPTLIKPINGRSMPAAIAAHLHAIEEQSRSLGRPIVAQINHPNFGWALTAADLAAVGEARFVEIYNGHPLINQLGDRTRPGAETMWDIANTIRIKQLGVPPLYGVAVDDTHEYRKQGMKAASPGRGWIVVRAGHLQTESLLAAMQAGDFYASTGVVLKDVQYSPGSGRLEVEIQPDGDAEFETCFIGTRANAAPTTRPSKEIGVILARTRGLKASYALRPGDLYVRAVITSSERAENPSLPNQHKQAWTQPVGWERSVRPDHHGRGVATGGLP